MAVHRVGSVARLLGFLAAVLVCGNLSTVFAVTGTPDQIGQWGSVLNWGVQGKHMTLLPNGSVLVWSTGDTARVWDPATGQFILTPATFGDLHCAGQTVLSDGRAAVFGGVKGGPPIGTKVTALFDPATNTWSQGKLMNYARWYATVTNLPDSRVLVTSGTDENGAKVATPEIYDPTTDTWSLLTGINRVQSYYPFMYSLANGKVFEAGPGQTTFYYDLNGVGTMTNGPSNLYNTPGISESGAMYLPGKIIRAGGNDPAVANTSIIDMNAATPTWQQIQSMAFPRRRLNIVLLADGTVMAVGGTRASDDATQAVLEGEIWDPDTKLWTVVAPMTEARMYHSTALLLPDGRVVAAGGEASGRLHAEIYSPAYLFKGPRPVINSAPSAVSYGDSITIGTDATDIVSVALLRPSAVTHAINMNQLYVPVTFTQGAGQVVATAPAGPNLTPPGFYLLVIKNSAGVPSVATWVQLAGNVSPASVTGTVTDSTALAIPGATITYNNVSVVTNASGVYTFDNVPAGTHDFTASGSGFGAATKSLHVDPGTLATLDFQLSAPANIQGVVRDAVDSAIVLAGATVGYVGGTVTTDANGAYTITGIAAGTQTITAVISGYQSAQASVTAVAGVTATQDFALAKTVTEILGNVSDAVTTLPIVGATATYSGGSTTTNSLGQYMFMNVAAGGYTVTVTAPGYVSQSHSVTVVQGIISTSDFTLVPVTGTGPTLTLNPTADAFVASSKATTNYGTQTTLQLRQGTASNPVTYHGYLQFNVTGLTGPVSSAKLRLFVTDGSADGGSLFDIASNWTEGAINWGNAPQASGAALGSGGVATTGKWMEISLPLSEFTRGNGVYSFELTTSSSDSAIFSSREAATGKPELVLAQGGSQPPSLTADFTANKQTGTASLTVNFSSAASTGNPTSWTWDFNNDNVVDSTQQNPSFTYNNPGQYTVKLTIGDGSTTSTVTKTNFINVSSVTSPGISATLLGDAAVTSSKATTNYGNQATLQLRQGTASNTLTYHSYLQFSLAGLTGAVNSAKLRLFVTDSSPDGGSVFDVSNSWSELAINWNNAPQPTSPTPIGRGGLATKGQWLEIPLQLSEFSRGNGTYSFELITTSSDSGLYSSKQSTSSPQLVVTQGP